MKTLRIVIAVSALALLIYTLIGLDYNDLTWQTNRSDFIVLIIMILMFIVLILNYLEVKKNNS